MSALSRRSGLGLLFALGLAFLALCGWIVARSPELFWNDGYDRMAHRDQILVWRWLPLLQAVLLVSSELSTRPETVRMVLALLSAGALAGCYALTARLYGRTEGLAAAAFLAGNALFVTLATVPYQEGLFALQVYGVLALLHEPATDGRATPLPGRARFFWAALVSNLACLNRFEGWILCAILAAEMFLRGLREGGWGRGLLHAALAGLAFGGAVAIVWLLVVPLGLHERETHFAARLSVSSALRILRELGAESLRQTSAAFLVLGATGALLAMRDRRNRTTHLRIGVFVLAFLALILLADPAPQGRRPWLFLVLLTPYAAHGLAAVARGLTARLPPRASNLIAVLATVFVAACLGHGSLKGVREVERYSTERPEVSSVQRAGEWLRARIRAQEAIVVGGETQRRAASVHAWVPMTRVLDAELDPGFGALRLRELSSIHGQVYVVLAGDAPGEPADSLRALQAGVDPGAPKVERVPREELPAGAAEVWIVRAP